MTVSLAKQSDDVPLVLSDPGLAIVKPAPDTSWPIGTGSFWATSATTTAQEIRAQNGRGDTLVFRIASGGDARDLLDAGVDLLMTRDRSLRDYAATLKDRVVIEDLHASIFNAMGISPKLAYEIEKRPFYVTRDGEGKVIQQLFA